MKEKPKEKDLSLELIRDISLEMTTGISRGMKNPIFVNVKVAIDVDDEGKIQTLSIPNLKWLVGKKIDL